MFFTQNMPCSRTPAINSCSIISYEYHSLVFYVYIFGRVLYCSYSCRDLIHEGKAAHCTDATSALTYRSITKHPLSHGIYHIYTCSEAWHLGMAPCLEPILLVARRSRAWAVTRSIVLQAAVIAFAAQLLVVGVGSTAAVPVARAPLVFRVEGSRHDPDFSRACGVVKGLEDLYGKDRYTLHSVR